MSGILATLAADPMTAVMTAVPHTLLSMQDPTR
jgi:hypothetical protein